MRNREILLMTRRNQGDSWNIITVIAHDNPLSRLESRDLEVL